MREAENYADNWNMLNKLLKRRGRVNLGQLIDY